MERWSANAHWSAERYSKKGSERGAIGYVGALSADEKKTGRGALRAKLPGARSADDPWTPPEVLGSPVFGRFQPFLINFFVFKFEEKILF